MLLQCRRKPIAIRDEYVTHDQDAVVGTMFWIHPARPETGRQYKIPNDMAIRALIEQRFAIGHLLVE